MIQDIAPHQYDNGYNPVPPDRDSIALYYEEHTALIKNTAEGIEFPGFADLERLNEEIYEEYTYLFSIDEERYYRADPQYRAFAGITGYQLYSWYKNHRYCGHCGSSMKKDKKERMLYCEECHNMEYPKICPATIIGVTDGNRLLMSKYAGRAYKKYALLAGFVEIGETVEETVKREVMEEVGLKVKNIRYYKSQPWGFTDSLLFGYFCELDGDDTIRLDTNELSQAGWYTRDEITLEDDYLSLTREMILQFKEGRV